MSASGMWVRTSVITPSIDASSFQAGMKTRVRKSSRLFHGGRNSKVFVTWFDKIVLVTPHGKRRRDFKAAARHSSDRYAAMADRRLRGGQLDHGRDRLFLRRQPPGAARRGADRGARRVPDRGGDLAPRGRPGAGRGGDGERLLRRAAEHLRA